MHMASKHSQVKWTICFSISFITDWNPVGAAALMAPCWLDPFDDPVAQASFALVGYARGSGVMG